MNGKESGAESGRNSGRFETDVSGISEPFAEWFDNETWIWRFALHDPTGYVFSYSTTGERDTTDETPRTPLRPKRNGSREKNPGYFTQVFGILEAELLYAADTVTFGLFGLARRRQGGARPDHAPELMPLLMLAASPNSRRKVASMPLRQLPYRQRLSQPLQVSGACN